MAKHIKRLRRERALEARKHVSQKQPESLIANELGQLIGAEKSDVVEMAKWRAKANYWFTLIGYFAVILIFAISTYQHRGIAGIDTILMFWGVVAFLSFFLLRDVIKYRKLIRKSR
jgi:hypothetical protein